MDIRRGLTFRQADLFLRKGYRAWKDNWPRDYWVERVVADDYRYILVEEGRQSEWEPDIHDLSQSDWCVSKG